MYFIVKTKDKILSTLTDVCSVKLGESEMTTPLTLKVTLIISLASVVVVLDPVELGVLIVGVDVQISL